MQILLSRNEALIVIIIKNNVIRKNNFNYYSSWNISFERNIREYREFSIWMENLREREREIVIGMKSGNSQLSKQSRFLKSIGSLDPFVVPYRVSDDYEAIQSSWEVYTRGLIWPGRRPINWTTIVAELLALIKFNLCDRWRAPSSGQGHRRFLSNRSSSLSRASGIKLII